MRIHANTLSKPPLQGPTTNYQRDDPRTEPGTVWGWRGIGRRWTDPLHRDGPGPRHHSVMCDEWWCDGGRYVRMIKAVFQAPTEVVCHWTA